MTYCSRSVARSRSSNAIDSYNEFVELWKNADPELQPQVEDVLRRIANLVGEPGASGPIN